jgi:hypothetical protein
MVGGIGSRPNKCSGSAILEVIGAHGFEPWTSPTRMTAVVDKAEGELPVNYRFLAACLGG